MGKVIAGNRTSFQIIKTKPTMSSSYTLQIPIKTLSYHQCVIDYNDDELRSSNNKSAASPYWKQGIPLKLCVRACVCVRMYTEISSKLPEFILSKTILYAQQNTDNCYK